MDNKKYRITVQLPKKLKKDINLSLVKQGYSLREKSKWMSDAIIKLFKMENFIELVGISADMDKLDDKEIIIMSSEAGEILNNGVIGVRKENPMMEGVKSKIIRAAVIHKIISGE